ATVGTMTEIVDFLRLVFARLGTVVCAKCGQEVHAQQTSDVIGAVEQLADGTRFAVAFPSVPEPGADPADWAAALREEGFLRLQVGADMVRLDEKQLPELGDRKNIHVLVDRLEAGKSPRERLTDSIETAFARGQ